jgi:hypothetical protein
MCYIQYINGEFRVVREVQLKHHNANTMDLGARIIKDLKGYQVYIVPDSTGHNRHSSATSTGSDHTVLKQLGLNLLPTSNPYIRDRQNTCNWHFFKKRLVLDPSCEETIKEIETLTSRENEGKVSHLAVTVGYVVYKLNPLKASNGKSTTIKF